ncbi:short-chain dehydrogenase TIC 32 B, chloroplastic-like [Zingiber officinale]|uniref:Uncharacterized protein n=1 Tax=Zingiber officinale TaxID=94328 RepID=A0A8J5G9U1_ZINOF|nr:short-chain dehydrogenase TIC 32 B, chloroplastic-like [Zingiber officinale]KAG6499003.1 hypothetical protein ZIOFF_038759 [Zingiber officinale]
MQRIGNIPNPSTIVALLPIVGQAKALIQGKSIHAVCIRRRIDKGDVLVNTALLDMYGKFECLVRARRISDSMSFRNEVTWSAMIGCYTLCGRMAEALQIFRSSGIGAETARVMALRGAHVIIGARNMEAANVVKENIQQSIPSAKVDVSELELSSQKSARAFADRFIERNLPLNVLINNAGVMNCPYKLSEDGIEMQFATNHLGHFLLINLLLEKMKNTAKESGIEGRIVNLSSVAHIGI